MMRKNQFGDWEEFADYLPVQPTKKIRRRQGVEAARADKARPNAVPA